MKIKQAFLSEINSSFATKSNNSVEEVEHYEDAFLVKFQRSSDKKEASQLVKSTIKVTFKPVAPLTVSPPLPSQPVVTTVPSQPIDSTPSSTNSSTISTPSPGKVIIVENHFERSLLSNNVDTKLIPAVNSQSNIPTSVTLNTQNLETNSQEPERKHTDSPYSSESVLSDDFLQLGKPKKKHADLTLEVPAQDEYIDENDHHRHKKQVVKSILKKKSSIVPEKEKSVTEYLTDLFPLFGGAIILIAFGKYNRVDYDTMVHMFASYLIGLAAMYVQSRFNESSK